MNVQIAAHRTKLTMFANAHGAQVMELDLPRRVQDKDNPWLLGHCCWMLDQILIKREAEGEPQVIGERAHRWLGYVQGVLITRGVAKLHELETVNREA